MKIRMPCSLCKYITATPYLKGSRLTVSSGSGVTTRSRFNPA